jgi:aminoglycoside phosphotransferase family enzyme
MAPLAESEADRRLLDSLREWAEREHAILRDIFDRRKSAGYIRECHGDLHLGNIVMLNGRPVPFDCIEFNPTLRFIDVTSEAAFLAMDLIDRNRADLAWRFLNGYLEITGDYGGVPVLRFYMVYRAMVRAKVHLMRAKEQRLARGEHKRLLGASGDYLRLANRLASSSRRALILAHGLSGSGKTTATQPLIEKLGAIRLRSDLERKRMHGLAALAGSGSGLNDGIYSRRNTVATYHRLAQLAREVLEAGYPVVVDATFLKRTEREVFRALAESMDAPYVILDFHAPFNVLRERVAARHARRNDASEADLQVLDRQIATREPLTPLEMEASVVVDGTRPPARQSWRRVLDRIAPAARGTRRSSRKAA